MEDPPVSYLLKTVSQRWVAFPGIKVLSAEKEVLGTKPCFLQTRIPGLTV